jgi:hypothetical protein
LVGGQLVNGGLAGDIVAAAEGNIDDDAAAIALGDEPAEFGEERLTDRRRD